MAKSVCHPPWDTDSHQKEGELLFHSEDREESVWKSTVPPGGLLVLSVSLFCEQTHTAILNREGCDYKGSKPPLEEKQHMVMAYITAELISSHT